MENNFENGITLVALVVTIIILLILSGVAISITLNSGLIQKTQKAKIDINEFQVREKLELILSEAKIAGESLEYIKEKIYAEKLGDYFDIRDVTEGIALKSKETQAELLITNNYTISEDEVFDIVYNAKDKKLPEAIDSRFSISLVGTVGGSSINFDNGTLNLIDANNGAYTRYGTEGITASVVELEFKNNNILDKDFYGTQISISDDSKTFYIEYRKSGAYLRIDDTGNPIKYFKDGKIFEINSTVYNKVRHEFNKDVCRVYLNNNLVYEINYSELRSGMKKSTAIINNATANPITTNIKSIKIKY